MKRRALLLVVLAAAPVLIAIWTVPYFITQDGPAHAYSARLLARLISGDRWLAESFVLQLRPLPNLLGHGVMAALSSVWPGRFADRLVMSLTLLLPALSLVALRREVRGDAGLHLIIPFAILLCLGRLWLLGFYSFLLGVTLFSATLAWWWRARNPVVLSLLLLGGWFAHLVSFAATLLALTILVVATRKRVVATTLAILPSIPLLVWYFGVMQSHRGIGASYVRLTGHSVGDFLQYARSIKVLSIATQTDLPFARFSSPALTILAPAVLAAIAFLIWWMSSARRLQPDAKPWVLVAIVFILIAIVAPDGLGMQHGGFLRERLFLLGLMCSVPVWNLDTGRAPRIAAAVALIGVVMQMGFVWEYAIESNQRVAPLAAAADQLPNRSRVFVIRPKPRDRFRASPTLHAANLLGLERDLVVWNNYQANLYFFPVNFRRPFIPCSDDGTCELREYGDRVDQLVFWDGGNRVIIKPR